MRTLFILFVACVILVGAGFYFHWFTFSTSTGSENTQIQVNVDRQKIHEDFDKIKQGSRELGREARQKVDSLIHQ